MIFRRIPRVWLRTTSQLSAVFAAAMLSCAPPPMPLDPDADWTTDARETSAGGAAILSPAPRPRPVPEAKRLRWDAAEVVATLRALPHDGPSEHGGGGYRQRILLDESASSGGKLGRKRAYAPGSRIIEELRRVGDDRVAAIFTMTKLPRGESPSTGDWRFEILDGELRVAADGDLSSCSRCHLEAENDSVFEPLLEATAAPRLDAMK